MSAIAIVAPADETPDPARAVLRQAQDRIVECQARVEAHQAAVRRGRQFVEDAEQGIAAAEVRTRGVARTAYSGSGRSRWRRWGKASERRPPSSLGA